MKCYTKSLVSYACIARGESMVGAPAVPIVASAISRTFIGYAGLLPLSAYPAIRSEIQKERRTNDLLPDNRKLLRAIPDSARVL